MLYTVAENIADHNKTELPKSKLIQRRSSNYYTVNVNSAIDANILEDFLVREFTKASITTDFEYHVYDCANDEYLYSNYCNLSEKTDQESVTSDHPRFEELIYYFVVKFPSRSSILINDLRVPLLFSLLTILAMLSFMYALWVILRQQQVTDLQKDFINNMTHEFKTPISSIKLASDYLLKDEKIKSDERLQKYSDIIKQQNSRLNNQVEKVLNIARLEKDQFKLVSENVLLQDFIQNIVRQEQIKFDDAGGEILLDFTPDPIYVSADKLHLTNVISNVLDNAKKYCKEKPKIRVSISEKKSKTYLTISDNGIGIPKEDLKKIFNKFYRISTGDVHNVKGFGLGLFYVKNICDAHGWDINIRSNTDKGTAVELILPILQEAKPV